MRYSRNKSIAPNLPVEKILCLNVNAYAFTDCTDIAKIKGIFASFDINYIFFSSVGLSNCLKILYVLEIILFERSMTRYKTTGQDATNSRSHKLQQITRVITTQQAVTLISKLIATQQQFKVFPSFFFNFSLNLREKRSKVNAICDISDRDF